MQPAEELAPVSLNLPAPQSTQEITSPVVILYFPGAHDSQLEEPALEKPAPQEVQLSVAPVEKVPEGHSSAAVLSALAL